ncbi:MAG: HNH endonuclease [Gammaproteobacteria bacterium]|nr:MAG: HNH endonuclease [Gammaproteobacteria bacterium]
MPSQEDIDKVWNKARAVRGEDSNKVRQDPYGNKIRRDQFGGRGSQSWEIDHIKPESKGGSDHLRNLQAMQTKKNRELGDSTRKRTRHK